MNYTVLKIPDAYTIEAAMEKVEIRLVARNNEILATRTTDAASSAHEAPRATLNAPRGPSSHAGAMPPPRTRASSVSRCSSCPS